MRLERERTADYAGPPIFAEMARSKDLYFGGDMEAAIALTGQVCGRIDSVKPVEQIIRETVDEFAATLARMGRSFSVD